MTQGRHRNRDLMFARLMRMIASPDHSVDIISAYFVPGRRFTQRLTRLAAEGVRVRILTNSQEATDVLVVHSAYVKYRPRLIDGGIRLYELRATRGLPREPRTPGTSTRASLHSTTVCVDRERIFIGSFNFDPRSARLNTELGFVIESPALAHRTSELFRGPIRQHAYQVHLSENGSLYWTEYRGDEIARHDKEPGTRSLQRAWVRFLSVLPIEWLL